MLTVAALCTAWGSVGVVPAAAQQAPSPDTTQAQRQVAGTPYESNRSLAYHVLASPAYVLHGITRPVGWTVKYLERNFPQIFEPEPQQRGVLPLVELGGPVGVTGGLALYDNRLFGTNQKARVDGVVGARGSFEVGLQYERPRLVGPRTSLSFDANFFWDPEDRFYISDTRSNRDTAEGIFSRRQVDLMTRIQYRSRGGIFASAFDVLYEHVDTSPASDERGALLAGLPGFNAVDLLTPRLELAFDLSRGAPRAYAGTRLLLRLDYTHDLNSDRFRYGRYVVEVQQYLPVLFFPKTRRLALRARLSQVEPMFDGEAVPFYQLPRLGGQQSLRGFRNDRFRNNGSLLFSAEYRYPVWSRMDAVFFVDTGQVFNELEAVDVGDFRTTFGGGFHILAGDGLSARFEVGRSVEGTEVILTVKPAFGRTPR